MVHDRQTRNNTINVELLWDAVSPMSLPIDILFLRTSQNREVGEFRYAVLPCISEFSKNGALPVGETNREGGQNPRKRCFNVLVTLMADISHAKDVCQALCKHNPV